MENEKEQVKWREEKGDFGSDFKSFRHFQLCLNKIFRLTVYNEGTLLNQDDDARRMLQLYATSHPSFDPNKELGYSCRPPRPERTYDSILEIKTPQWFDYLPPGVNWACDIGACFRNGKLVYVSRHPEKLDEDIPFSEFISEVEKNSDGRSLTNLLFDLNLPKEVSDRFIGIK